MLALLITTCILTAIGVVLLVLQRGKSAELIALQAELRSMHQSLMKMETAFKEDFRSNREETGNSAREARQDLKEALSDFRRELGESVKSLVHTTEDRLEKMRETVDEKLQKTLNERLGQSFAIVGKQLESVQKGLGEMQTIAQDVGGLKRVLSNVKMRGGFGEVQLSMLLESILAPDQYSSNVKTKEGAAGLVEFAIKLPNPDGDRKWVWLPIDAKFPREAYERLQDAYDVSDLVLIAEEQKSLDNTIRRMAKDICEKYIDPPGTTDFGILFLPFEGIYAEVVRKPALLESIQRECKVIVTGPTTLAALLNSLQMGFRTLAIQKRSSEVWQVLSSVKKEFETFGGLLEKAQKNLHSASNTLDEVVGKRTRAIQKKLNGVETSGDQKLLPEDDAMAEFEE